MTAQPDRPWWWTHVRREDSRELRVMTEMFAPEVVELEVAFKSLRLFLEDGINDEDGFPLVNGMATDTLMVMASNLVVARRLRLRAEMQS